MDWDWEYTESYHTYQRLPSFYVTFLNCDDMHEHTVEFEMQAGATVDDARKYFLSTTGSQPNMRIIIYSVWDADMINKMYLQGNAPHEVLRYLGHLPPREFQQPTDRVDPIDPYDSGKSDQDNQDFEDGDEWKKLL